ncbi:response regulator transcription factor [Paenarthrobacter sp. DKR-5]|uniref:response regulator transcription factor n=1 Tax=Paenarthrobacter sp. DKR-5 TaxID=2835535 RepID=UPI001BDD9AAD|nr:response regulator transcription factor [Paenarthrobacter sp. DKR-5]MBT1001568.1 response regulator transcription factor [Paenarthrobacter sp. DKR-5]
MSTAERPTLLLVEDDKALGPMIADVLAGDYDVTLAANGQEGLHLGLVRAWDVIVVDRGLPVMDGLSLVAALRKKGIGTPVLMLTALGATADKVEGLDAGANDYLTKPFDLAELEARLRALTRRYEAPAGRLAVGEWDFEPAVRTVTSPYGEQVFLTAKEAGLLAALAGAPHRVFTREELIAAAFSPEDLPGVVDTYVHYLRRKIAKSVVRTVHGTGYQLGEPD